MYLWGAKLVHKYLICTEEKPGGHYNECNFNETMLISEKRTYIDVLVGC